MSTYRQLGKLRNKKCRRKFTIFWLVNNCFIIYLNTVHSTIIRDGTDIRLFLYPVTGWIGIKFLISGYYKEFVLKLLRRHLDYEPEIQIGI